MNPQEEQPKKAGNSKISIEDFIKKLNTQIADEYGYEYTAVDKDIYGRYIASKDVGDEYVISQILDSDELSDDDKEKLLYEEFGFSDEKINRIASQIQYGYKARD